MRNYFFCLLLLFGCKKDDTNDSSSHPNLYGEGVYIVTDEAINYYNDITGDLQENIFMSANGTRINNPKKIVLEDQNAFIVGNRLYVVDIDNFHLKGEVSGFNNLTDCNIISFNRALASDQGESKVKVVDLDRYEIETDIETGDSTKPSFIISNWNRAFVLNGGGVPKIKKDTTVVIIDHKNDAGLPLSDFAGKTIIGDNPNSAIIRGSELIVLCKGVYNINFPSSNSIASFYKISRNSGSINDIILLPGVYNANSLVASTNNEELYFTAIDGVYKCLLPSMSYSLFLNRQSSILSVNNEKYNTTDSTHVYTDMIYMNDTQRPGYIFKYNTFLNTYTDSFTVVGNILDISAK